MRGDSKKVVRFTVDGAPPKMPEPKAKPLGSVTLADVAIVPLRTIRAARALCDRVLAAQGDAAEPEIIQLQHELSQLEHDAAHTHRINF